MTAQVDLEFFKKAGRRGARKAKEMFTTKDRRAFGKLGGRPVTSRGPDVPCKTCKAKAGQHCKTRGGQILYGRPHSTRSAAA